MTKYANIIINGVLETKHCKDNDNDASWRISKKKLVKRKDFLLFMYFSLFIHAPKKRDKLKLIVLKAEVEADKLKLSEQKNGTMAVLQFLSTARVSTQE